MWIHEIHSSSFIILQDKIYQDPHLKLFRCELIAFQNRQFATKLKPPKSNVHRNSHLYQSLNLLEEVISEILPNASGSNLSIFFPGCRFFSDKVFLTFLHFWELQASVATPFLISVLEHIFLSFAKNITPYYIWLSRILILVQFRIFLLGVMRRQINDT